MKLLLINSVIASIALLAAQVAQAEVIEISVSKQSPELQAIERPANGISKEQVESTFGSPKEVLEATGEPPITTWIYDHFSVYFEYNTVLHSVLHQQTAEVE